MYPSLVQETASKFIKKDHLNVAEFACAEGMFMKDLLRRFKEIDLNCTSFGIDYTKGYNIHQEINTRIYSDQVTFLHEPAQTVKLLGIDLVVANELLDDLEVVVFNYEKGNITVCAYDTDSYLRHGKTEFLKIDHPVVNFFLNFGICSKIFFEL